MYLRNNRRKALYCFEIRQIFWCKKTANFLSKSVLRGIKGIAHCALYTYLCSMPQLRVTPSKFHNRFLYGPGDYQLMINYNDRNCYLAVWTHYWRVTDTSRYVYMSCNNKMENYWPAWSGVDRLIVQLWIICVTHRPGTAWNTGNRKTLVWIFCLWVFIRVFSKILFRVVFGRTISDRSILRLEECETCWTPSGVADKSQSHTADAAAACKTSGGVRGSRSPQSDRHTVTDTSAVSTKVCHSLSVTPRLHYKVVRFLSRRNLWRFPTPIFRGCFTVLLFSAK